MNMGSEIGFDIDFDDSAARRVRHYVRQVVTGLGLRGDSSCIDAEPRVGAYVALDGRLPDFPEHYVALVWNELAGWSVADHFDPPHLVKVLLGLTSVWLVVVGIAMQAFPARRPKRLV